MMNSKFLSCTSLLAYTSLASNAKIHTAVCFHYYFHAILYTVYFDPLILFVLPYPCVSEFFFLFSIPHNCILFSFSFHCCLDWTDYPAHLEFSPGKEATPFTMIPQIAGDTCQTIERSPQLHSALLCEGGICDFTVH